jgi:ribosomal protein L37AE/L43A
VEQRKKPRGIPQGPFLRRNKIADWSRDSNSSNSSWLCPRCDWGRVRRGVERWLCVACGFSIPQLDIAALTESGPSWIGLNELVSTLSALPEGEWSA